MQFADRSAQKSNTPSDSRFPRCHKRWRLAVEVKRNPVTSLYRPGRALGYTDASAAKSGLFRVVYLRDGVHGAADAAVVRQEAAAGRHRAADRRDRGQPEFTVAHGKRNRRFDRLFMSVCLCVV